MAKQSFTTGQVLTAAQMTSLQETAMGGGPATAKTASYTLVAADAGTVVRMNAAGATTITVNTSLFSAGDTVYIQNIGAGVCTITAGTATVNTASSLALAQYEGGTLYFTAASASLFFKASGAAAGGGGKVLQVEQGTFATDTFTTSVSFSDTGLTKNITPTVATSKVLVMITIPYYLLKASATVTNGKFKIMRGATEIGNYSGASTIALTGASGNIEVDGTWAITFLDSPATTSATTYKVQAASINGTVGWCAGSTTATITLMEIGA